MARAYQVGLVPGTVSVSVPGTMSVPGTVPVPAGLSPNLLSWSQPRPAQPSPILLHHRPAGILEAPLGARAKHADKPLGAWWCQDSGRAQKVPPSPLETA